MRLGIETKVVGKVRYTIDFTGHGEVVVIARNLISGRTKLCYYETSRYSFRDGYDMNDLIEIYRLTDEIVESLQDG